MQQAGEPGPRPARGRKLQVEPAGRSSVLLKAGGAGQLSSLQFGYSRRFLAPKRSQRASPVAQRGGERGSAASGSDIRLSEARGVAPLGPQGRAKAECGGQPDGCFGVKKRRSGPPSCPLHPPGRPRCKLGGNCCLWGPWGAPWRPPGGLTNAGSSPLPNDAPSSPGGRGRGAAEGRGKQALRAQADGGMEGSQCVGLCGRAAASKGCVGAWRELCSKCGAGARQGAESYQPPVR